jgi:probable selenium-dependent hydroxylase accessory protein YqeC
MVIIICGANVVGAPLNTETVHRAELFSQKWNLPFGTVITPEIIANELLSPHSYLRNIPLRAEVRILINQCDKNPIGGRLLAEHLMRKCQYPVYLGSIQQTKLERIA